MRDPTHQVLILYQTEDGSARIEQALMAEVFDIIGTLNHDLKGDTR